MEGNQYCPIGVNHRRATQTYRGIASDVTTRKSAVFWGARSEPTEIVLGQNRLNCLASTDRLHKCSDFRKISCYTRVYLTI